ncbi:MAG: peptide chain release factor 1, partial [Thermoplasmata archaeon]
DESGLRELVEKARKTLADLDLMREKRLMQAFLEEVKRPDEGLAVYGEAEIRRALELGAVDTLLISEAIRKVRMGVSCPVCGYQGVVTAESVNPGQCPKCGADLSMDEKVDLVEDLHDKAERLGTKVELISEDSEEGKLFWRAFAGLGGILRYRVS